MGIRAARSGAEATVGDVDVDVGRRRRRQQVGVSRRLQLLHGVGQRGERQRPVAGDPQGERRRGQLEPLRVEVEAVLLRPDERDDELADRRLPPPEPDGRPPIRIRVARSETEPA